MRYWEAEEERERKALETCLTCGEKGHDKRSCTHELCLACGALDEHSTRECKQGVTCFRCGQRGHRLSECKQPRRAGGGGGSGPRGWAGRECMRCGSVRHLDANCPTLWRTYFYNDAEDLHAVRKVKWAEYGQRESRKSQRVNVGYRSDDDDEAQEDAESSTNRESATPPFEWDPAQRWCYNCAGKGHWGDDCPEPRCNLGRSTGEPSAYSEHLARSGPFASRYAAPPPQIAKFDRVDQFQVDRNASMHIVDMPDDQHMGTRSFARRKAKEDRGMAAEQQASKKERLQQRLQDEQKARERAREAFKGDKPGRADTEDERERKRKRKERKAMKKLKRRLKNTANADAST